MVKVSELKDMTTKQLRDLIARAEELVERRRVEEIKESRAKIAAMANELGVSVNELLGLKSGKKAAARSGGSRPKYRSKADPTLTWSGRGRMATWLAEEIKAGKSKDSFLIKN